MAIFDKLYRVVDTIVTVRLSKGEHLKGGSDYVHKSFRGSSLKVKRGNLSNYCATFSSKGDDYGDFVAWARRYKFGGLTRTDKQGPRNAEIRPCGQHCGSR